MVFIFLAYFTLYNGLQFHPSHFALFYKDKILSLKHNLKFKRLDMAKVFISWPNFNGDIK